MRKVTMNITDKIGRLLGEANNSFSCMECGHKYKTPQEAKDVWHGKSKCPKCGSESLSVKKK
jgi:Zn finger protein HypA/HybF involved in hydrogenase expression